MSFLNTQRLVLRYLSHLFRPPQKLYLAVWFVSFFINTFLPNCNCFFDVRLINLWFDDLSALTGAVKKIRDTFLTHSPLPPLHVTFYFKKIIVFLDFGALKCEIN